jgi:protein-disulfide isomerase
MGKRHGWLIALVLMALLVAACGPTMATPTPGGETPSGDTSSGMASVQKTPTAAQEATPTERPSSGGELQVDEDDWHVLGSPDALVTIVDYSDYQ